jgi:hypothetical protein
LFGRENVNSSLPFPLDGEGMEKKNGTVKKGFQGGESPTCQPNMPEIDTLNRRRPDENTTLPKDSVSLLKETKKSTDTVATIVGSDVRQDKTSQKDIQSVVVEWKGVAKVVEEESDLPRPQEFWAFLLQPGTGKGQKFLAEVNGDSLLDGRESFQVIDQKGTRTATQIANNLRVWVDSKGDGVLDKVTVRSCSLQVRVKTTVTTPKRFLTLQGHCTSLAISL